jgi:(1->4)-alpha-D-glucan 1-alpha-D-glucosylmutase
MTGRPLDALADYLGVAWSPASDPAGAGTDASKRAVLAALGQSLTAGREQRDAAAALAQLRARDAGRVLPPTLVLEAEARSLTLRPRLPAALSGQALRWRVTLENGVQRNGLVVARRSSEACDEAGGGAAADLPIDSPELAPLALTLAIDIPPGAHQFSLYASGAPAQALATAELLVCPARCFDARGVGDGRRLWGVCAQVYALRSPRDWGSGDFGDLRRLIDLAADAGAHLVGVNPLHALFPCDPERADPDCPSSREWLNVLYLDIEAMRDFGESREAREHAATPNFRARLERLRAQPRVDYRGVAAAKFEVLDLLYRHFRNQHLGRATQRAGLFRDFQRAGGVSLRRHALFDCLHENFHRLDPSAAGWTGWPAAYRDVQGAAVEAFELDNEERIEFFEYLQWQADGQLQAVAQRARARGMRVGLCRDLAAGVDANGSEAWSQPALHARNAHAGAPPDPDAPAGEDGDDWGIAPAIPQQLVDGGYAAFLAVARANMRHAGALRVDRVARLWRAFWRPTSTAGACVAYPMDNLFRLLCLESRRQRCIVIGAERGVTPVAVAQAMDRYGVLSGCPLFAQRDAQGAFRPPSAWPTAALALSGSQQLPTWRGCWTGFERELRAEPGADRDPAKRGRDQRALLAALDSAGFALHDGAPFGEVAAALCAYIASTPALLAAVRLEDFLGRLAAEPETRPSDDRDCRHKLDESLADIAADRRWQAIAVAMNAERACPPLPVSGGPRHFQAQNAMIPRATYRLQFHSAFGFNAANAVLPYLADLGISDVYAAPFLKARPGSRHGYDIVDHRTVNPEIGSRADFDRYCARLAELGLGQVLDVVPNHVGVLGADNEWWLDVLENGPAAEHAEHFDIDWEPPFAELRGKVLLPVLADQYGLILEAGELALDFCATRGEFSVRYFAHRFPIDPDDYPALLSAGNAAEDAAGVDAAFATLLAALRNLPPRTVGDAALIAERRRNKELFKQQLAELYARLPALRERIATRLAAFKGRPGEAESFDALNELLERQAYRLASWRVATDDINYRRFFDINDLAALRIENDAVFEATHAQIFDWLGERRVSGLRIDHPDGLADPAAYFERLQARYAQRRADAPDGAPPAVLYVVAEKIVGEFEALPDDWPVHGDTGYRFANFCNALFVDAAQESRFSRVYRAFTGEARDFGEVLREARELIMTHSLPGDLGSLAFLLHDIAQCDRRTRDFTRSRLRGALLEIVAGFPVYRSYIGPRGVSENDRRTIEGAVDAAARRGLAGDASVLYFVRDVLLSAPGEPVAALRRLKLAFARRFQQFTAPVMAKAMEDTAFYRYNRLVSLNEVGGDPRNFGSSVEDFHAANERLSCTHPFGLLASSTHDSKRSEDVRARLDVLSEMPGAWRLALRRWRRMNAGRKSRIGRGSAPSDNDEYLLYQTLLGIWPMVAPDAAGIAELSARIEAYLLKAAREAKKHTSWMNPDAAYEAALTVFVRRLLVPGPASDRFLADFLPVQATVAHFGCLNSLNMLLLKLTAPGVPDIYQGCELWNFSLVDPDNRRPVDFSAAREHLGALRRDYPQGADSEAVRRLYAERADGRIKLYLLWRGLQARKSFTAPLRHGRYVPLEVSGPAARHVVAFARVHGKETLIVIATRFLYGLCRGDPARLSVPECWADTTVSLPWALSAGAWHDTLTGRRVAAVHRGRHAWIELTTLFDPLPLALLLPDAGAP